MSESGQTPEPATGEKTGTTTEIGQAGKSTESGNKQPILIIVVPMLLFGLFMLAAAIGLQDDPRKLDSALIGAPAPEFTLPPLEGRPAARSVDGLAKADLVTGGRPVLVNVWASWCGPCRVEHPLLMQLAREGVPIYGINQKDRPEAANRFLRELGDPYERVGVDRTGRVSIDWGVYGVPETYVVDGNGIIRARHVGPLTVEDVEKTLIPALRKAFQESGTQPKPRASSPAGTTD